MDTMWIDEEGWAHYYKHPDIPESEDHAIVGAIMSQDMLRRLRFSEERVERISSLVEGHMFPVFTKQSGARRFVNKMGKHAKDLLLLRWADAGGKEYDFHPQVQLMDQLVAHVLEKDQAVTRAQLAISGHDLLDIGYEPGAKLGATLDHLLERVLEAPELNERETLIRTARTLL
jgi:tRNA nucleotidyltransferase (CCA-adding enzyme)